MGPDRAFDCNMLPQITSSLSQSVSRVLQLKPLTPMVSSISNKLRIGAPVFLSRRQRILSQQLEWGMSELPRSTWWCCDQLRLHWP
jgi:hypothetical protein